MRRPENSKKSANAVLFLGLLLVAVACAFARPAEFLLLPAKQAETAIVIPTTTQRLVYRPGELVAYTAQTGDNLPMLAARFNTTEESIWKANPILPAKVSTLPQGLPMQIPIYYLPFWGSEFRIIPNSAFVYSFNMENYDFSSSLAEAAMHSKAALQVASLDGMPERFQQTCLQASIDPRLVLSLIEYGLIERSGLELASEVLLEGISQNNLDQLQRWLGILNEGYYRFETGRLVELELLDGTIERLDPWQNAASAAVRLFFSQMLDTTSAYQNGVDPSGFAATYKKLFGDPWLREVEVLPGSLEWIPAGLPINPRGGWQAASLQNEAFTSMPWSGVMAGFHASSQNSKDMNAYGKVFASISGSITRLDATQLVVTQGGMPETRGWSLVYYGVTVKPGLKVGDRVENGESLGHVDASAWNASFWLARKYNGEWVGANAVVPFTLGGWKLALDKGGRNLSMQKPEMTIYSQPSKSQTNLIPNN